MTFKMAYSWMKCFSTLWNIWSLNDSWYFLMKLNIIKVRFRFRLNSLTDICVTFYTRSFPERMNFPQLINTFYTHAYVLIRARYENAVSSLVITLSVRLSLQICQKTHADDSSNVLCSLAYYASKQFFSTN